MAEKKSRWGKKKESKEPAAPPVLPVRKIDYELPDAICMQVENYYTIAECERYLHMLKDVLDWRRQRVEVGGFDTGRANVVEPRLTLFMSDPGIFYEYSGRENEGVDWHPVVLEIKAKAERALVEECGQPPVVFNSVQLNRYDNPKHALGFHADNEPDLVKGEAIASVSFGATRDFVILDRGDPDNRRWTVPLGDGAFMVMGGNMQNRYLHGVPASKMGDAGGLRINLTFRVIIPRERDCGPAARSQARREAEEATAWAASAAHGQAAESGADRPVDWSTQRPWERPEQTGDRGRFRQTGGRGRGQPGPKDLLRDVSKV